MKSILIEDGNPARFPLKTTTDNQNQSEPYRKIIFGERDPEKAHKIILMVGETGTGKTTLINTMINYTCGVQREDKIWIEITDDQSDRTSAHSQTSVITVYGVYIPESSLDLTIIDTSGYGDTRDISSYQKIAVNLLSLYRSENELKEIDAVYLVINAHQTRLTDSQRYTFDAVQSLFAEDINENIELLFTHSNGFPPKNALTTVKEAKVKCAEDEKNQPIYFLFDNRQSMSSDQDCDLSYNGMEGFFTFLNHIRKKAFRSTQKVLQKRQQLEENIPELKLLVQTIEQKQHELKQAQNDLKKHKENKNFELKVEVPYRVKVDIDTDVAKQATCCSICEENCHYPGCWWFCDFRACSVMKKDHCTVCPQKCHNSKHVKENKIYVTKKKTEKMINEDLKKEYDDKTENNLSLINKLKEEVQELEKKKIRLVIDAFHCVEVLEKIALNTCSLFIPKHIELLTEKCKEINKPEKAEELEHQEEREQGVNDHDN